jgi:hypothetical protein
MEPAENVCERRRIHGLVMISPSHTYTHTCVKLAIYYTFFHCALTDKKKPNAERVGDGGAGSRTKRKERAARQIERVPAPSALARKFVSRPQMPHAGVHQADEPP